eukprot:m.211641 g.211641  ORF g.211641 m.211641 type:complete len:82 (+) comp18675_c0_seq1:67-312(+)
MASRVAHAEAAETEEVVDHAPAIREECAESHHCHGFKTELTKCNERVASRPGTTETCTQELFDLLHCVDHCAADKIFAKLK